jgi:membrane protease subunit HflC
MRVKAIILFVVIALAFAVATLGLYVVDETEAVVLTQLGRPVASITSPGLYIKWPEPIQSIQRFNKRLQVYSPQQAEYLTADKKAIRVESYVAGNSSTRFSSWSVWASARAQKRASRT